MSNLSARHSFFHEQLGLDTTNLSCPWFYGIDSNEFSYWIQSIEEYFDIRGYDDPTRCLVASMNFLMHAEDWWEDLEWQRIRDGKPRIQSWKTLKGLLTQRFNPDVAKERSTAATIIQAHARGLLQRQLFLRMQRSVIIIQGHIRQWMHRRTSSLTVDAPPAILISSARDPFLMSDDAPEGKFDSVEVSPVCAETDDNRGQLIQFVWGLTDTEAQSSMFPLTPHVEMILSSMDTEGAAPPRDFIGYQMLRLRPPPKPPKVRSIICSSVKPASEAGTASQMLLDSGAQCRPPAKPPWKL